MLNVDVSWFSGGAAAGARLTFEKQKNKQKPLALVILGLFSCSKQPNKPNGNSTFKIDLLNPLHLPPNSFIFPLITKLLVFYEKIDFFMIFLDV